MKPKRQSVKRWFEAGRLAMRPYLSTFAYDADLDVWVGRNPELRGCMTQADTLIEARLMLYDARTSWIEHSLAYGLEIPTPSGLVQEIAVYVYDGNGKQI